jgi:hypothetical protein
MQNRLNNYRDVWDTRVQGKGMAQSILGHCGGNDSACVNTDMACFVYNTARDQAKKIDTGRTYCIGKYLQA